MIEAAEAGVFSAASSGGEVELEVLGREVADGDGPGDEGFFIIFFFPRRGGHLEGRFVVVGHFEGRFVVVVFLVDAVDVFFVVVVEEVFVLYGGGGLEVDVREGGRYGW